MVDSGLRSDKSPASIKQAAESGNLAAQYELGMMCEHGLGVAKDQQAAIFWYCSAAQGGSENAQYKLALMYEHGHGVQQDFAIAYMWLRKAAEAGLPEAQYKLGFYLEQGRATEADPAQAAKFYKRAAEAGIADAHFRLGFLYETGKGVPTDLEAAARFYEVAAAAGNSNAQYALGVLYVTGQGGKKDLAQAEKLFESAASHGHVRARSKYEETREIVANLPKMGVVSDVVESKRKQAELDKNEDSLSKAMLSVFKKAMIPTLPSAFIFFIVKFTPLGQLLADFSAQNRVLMIVIALICTFVTLATGAAFFKMKTKPSWYKLTFVGILAMVALGLVIVLMSPEAQIKEASDKDKKAAEAATAASKANSVKARPVSAVSPKDERTNSQLLKKATKGDTKAQVQLAVRYELGDNGLDQSDKHAFEWYSSAAKLNDKFAQCRLGMMYLNGGAGKRNPTQAVKWLQKAASQKYAPADYQLGLMYEYGEGVPESPKNAASWYRKGVKLQERHNEYRLGLMTLEGRGVAADVRRALELMQSAAKQELPEAGAKLAEIYRAGTVVPKNEALAVKWAEAGGGKPLFVLPGTDDWLYEQAEKGTIKTPEQKAAEAEQRAREEAIAKRNGGAGGANGGAGGANGGAGGANGAASGGTKSDASGAAIPGRGAR